MTTARDIMSRGVRYIPATETLDRAAQLMRELNVGVLPIYDTDERLIGMLTDRDIVVKCVGVGHDPAQVTAGSLAEGAPHTIDADASAGEVIAEMIKYKVRRIPVVEDGKVTGIISESDIVRNLDQPDVHSFVSHVYAI
jgi:CBS domain-containing protein